MRQRRLNQDAARARRTAGEAGPGRPRVLTKRVYAPAAPGDGRRVLVMRYWPRGVRKSRVDLWLKELGAPPELLPLFKSGRLPWADYRRAYLSGLRKPAARAAYERLRGLAAAGTVTLLCSCADPQRCHRTLLQRRLARRKSTAAR